MGISNQGLELLVEVAVEAREALRDLQSEERMLYDTIGRQESTIATLQKDLERTRAGLTDAINESDLAFKRVTELEEIVAGMRADAALAVRVPLDSNVGPQVEINVTPDFTIGDTVKVLPDPFFRELGKELEHFTDSGYNDYAGQLGVILEEADVDGDYFVRLVDGDETYFAPESLIQVTA
jgi:hypothetical protein